MTGFKSAISLFILIALTGCGTMSQAPAYTAREKNALTFAIIGQAADMLTTSLALSNDDFSEANPVFGDAGTDTELLTAMISSKIILIGGGYLVGQVWPEAREWMWYGVGGVGAGFAGFNTIQLIK